jgi:glycosyltransferase involved in cell wall biosynthesis
MTIGIDISALQSAHRMRGIGFTVLNFINHISYEDRRNNKFIIYMFKEDSDNTLGLLNLADLDYEIRFLNSKLLNQATGRSRILGRLQRLINSSIRQLGELKDMYLGDSRINDLSGIDAFIQPDQSKSLPKGFRIKKILIVYDIIPYVLEWDYLWSYRTARKVHGFSRKAALRCHIRRGLYIKKLKVNAKKANLLLAISQHTKDDFVRFVGMKPSKVKVTHLGVELEQHKPPSEVSYKRYLGTSWGYIARDYKFEDNIPFLLFVGGADQRRRLDHLVTSFSHLRARGHDIKLVLAGDTMQGPKNIPTLQIQNALLQCSYIDDIIFMGFISDEMRESLYEKALAVVYPSTYEGFGLPILEAMKYGTPVITYNNSSINEIAKESALYAHDYLSILSLVEELMDNNSLREKYAKLGQSQASKFAWEKTVSNMLDSIK